ncbi:MAG: hypothetical protein GY853_13825 [PVC group bacterium]|nr:hypothetical protein [PVC group bacterium]
MGVLNTPPQLANASLIAGFDKKLQMKSSLLDIYENSSGMYVMENKKIPNAIRMMVDQKVADKNNITITFTGELQGLGIYDLTRARGLERYPITKSVTVYRNIVRKVVGEPGYGPDELDAKPYGLYEQWIDQLGEWNRQHHGLSLRQCVLEQYGESLQYGRTAAFCPRNWTPNILVAGRSLRNMQVPYQTNRATYTTNIVNAIFASGANSLTPLVTQTLNMPNLSNAQNACLGMRIEKLSIPGFSAGGWILTMSELQATYLTDPVWSTRNLGSQYMQFNDLNEKVQNWYGVMGRYKDFLLVQDILQPTLIISGTSAPWGMTAGYMYPGTDDDRERDDDDTRDTANILGKAAVIDWNPQKLHHISDDDDYKITLGHGTSLVEGVSQPIYDDEAPRFGSHEQYTSAVMICGLPDYV